MITVSTQAYITLQNPFVFLSGVPAGDYDVVVVLQPRTGRKKRRRAGFGKAKITMSADFNAPLDDFKDYM